MWPFPQQTLRRGRYWATLLSEAVESRYSRSLFSLRLSWPQRGLQGEGITSSQQNFRKRTAPMNTIQACKPSPSKRLKRSFPHQGILPAAAICFFIAASLSPLSSPVMAQSRQHLPNVHYFLNANQAPGAVAGAQVARGGRGIGTYQAVSMTGPSGLNVALARDGQFLPPLEAPVTTGMLVGGVYRFRVTNIPFRPGEELYPTVEVIDRIYPPAGREHRFPIPIVLTSEDLGLALDGALVTRVIYLEDSEIAEPIGTQPDLQMVLNVPTSDNALQIADQLGRPVAILRIGSRVPMDLLGDLSDFLYGCPPWVPLITAPDRQSLIESGQWPEGLPVPPAESPFSETPLEDSPRTPF